MTTDLIQQSASYVRALLESRLPASVVYHNYRHARAVAENCAHVGTGSGLNRRDLERTIIAAWFHDTGYIETYDGHEEASAVIAQRFLADHRMSDDTVRVITSCIRATKIPQHPGGIVEAVLCDADLLNFGQPGFLQSNDLIREEWKLALGRTYSDAEWLQKSLSLIERHRFQTPYAEQMYGAQRSENIKGLKRKLQNVTAAVPR